MARKSKIEQFGRVQSMGAGLRKHFAGQTLSFANQTLTVANILDVFGALAAQIAKVNAAHNAWMKELVDERAMRTKRVAPLMLGLESLVRTRYGKSNATLLDFGMVPARRRKPRAAVKVAAIAKAAATRKARGTTGGKRRRSRR